MLPPPSVRALLLASASIAAYLGFHDSPAVPLPHHPHDVCSVVTLPPNFPADPTVFTASYGSMNLFLRSGNRGFGWRNMRSGMRGHRVSDCELVPDWDKSKVMYVALGQGGLQRSTNGGETWGKPLIRKEVTQVEAVEGINGGRPVVCAGGNSIWFSPDGGDSWAALGETPRTVQALAIPDSFAKDPYIAVGIAAPTLYTKKGTELWRTATIPSPAHTIEFSPNFIEDRTIWVGTYGHGLLKSVDAGATFQRVDGLVPVEINDIVIAPTWPACRDIYVATPRDGVHASRDGGTTWTRVPLLVAETRQTKNHYQSLAISSTYPDDPTVYCGAYEGLYCTNNAGDNWFELNLNPTRIGRKVAISQQYGRDAHVFFAGYGNPLAVTEDGGDSWEFRFRGSRTMGAYSVAASPNFETDKLVMLGAGPGIRRSTDAGRTWEKIDIKPMSPSLKIGSYETRQIQFSPDFDNDKSVFAVTAAGFYHSKDAGKTWKGYEVPVDWTWRMTVAPDWAESRTAFLGGYSVWRSDNGGAEWKKLAATGKVLGITCAPDFATSGEVFLVSQSRGLLRSKDHGDTWTPVTGAFEDFSPTKIRLSPSFLKDGTIFVSTVSGGMFWSHDRGESWDRCAPLGGPCDACFDFVFSPEYATDKTLFGCTFAGLVKSTDNGRTWTLKTNVEIYDDMRDPWLFRGAWQPWGAKGLFSYGAHRAQTAGCDAVLAFTGNGIKVLGTCGPDHGKCEILIDGKKVADVDCYAETMSEEYVLYATTELEQGFHDICIRALGTADSRSMGAWVSVDAGIVSYSHDDGNNPQFADLSNLYLTPDASYARDTRGQNKEMDKLVASLKNPAATAVTPTIGGGEAHEFTTSDRELRDLLVSMRSQLQHIASDLIILHDRIDSLDRAIAAREKKKGK